MPQPIGSSPRGLTTTRTNCSINESSLATSTARSPTALRCKSRLIKSRPYVAFFRSRSSPAVWGDLGLEPESWLYPVCVHFETAQNRRPTLKKNLRCPVSVSYTHLRAHET